MIYDDEIIPRNVFLITCSEEEKLGFLVNQTKNVNISITDKIRYDESLEKWQSLNEDETKMTLVDFFNNDKFEFFTIENKLDVNLFDKYKVFFERNGKVKTGRNEEAVYPKKTYSVFDDKIYAEEIDNRQKEEIEEKLENIYRNLLGRELQLKEMNLNPEKTKTKLKIDK